MTFPYRPAAVVAASLMLAGCSGGGGGTPAPTATSTAIVDLAVGDCISGDLTVVDCSTEHDSEAYASITVPGDDFPGDESIATQAGQGCTDAFTEFVGIPYDDSSLDYAFYFPTEGSWAAGDRRILCLIVDPETRVAGSLEGAAR